MNYEQLLKKARDSLPKDIHKKARFEIPNIESFVQGNVTNVTNFSQVSKYLNRDPKHMMKFFLREIATSGNLSGTKAVFTGKFPRHILQKKLEAYINEFVRCKECGHADTKLVKEERLMFMTCMACNAKSPVRRIK
jgi:translation initiation factor 2 subunit 2